MTKIKTPDGKIHNLTEMDFEPALEPWIEYKLSDGTVMKLKTSLVSVARSDQINERGEPFYFTQSVTNQRCFVPPELVKNDGIIEIAKRDAPEGYR